MMIIQLLLTSIILGIIYKKMLKWECDMSINKKQAFVPIFLGVLATIYRRKYTECGYKIFRNILLASRIN